MEFNFIYFGFALFFMTITTAVGMIVSNTIIKLCNIKNDNTEVIINVLIIFLVIPITFLKLLSL